LVVVLVEVVPAVLALVQEQERELVVWELLV
jgi:hypothetical protein